MIIFPAIDIQEGQCVRLIKGDFSTVEQVASDPLEAALSFEVLGAQWLHMVDLDGARLGKPVNQDIFAKITRLTNLKIQLGGGIRDLDTIETYIQSGIQRVVLGTAAIRSPQLVKDALSRFPDQIVVGIDAMHEKVMVSGWLESGDDHYLSLAKAMEDVGVDTLIFTDISKDGTLSGPNFEQLQALQRKVNCKIIASGGIRHMDHLYTLREMGLHGAICGKSIYKGTLDLAEALNMDNDK